MPHIFSDILLRRKVKSIISQPECVSQHYIIELLEYFECILLIFYEKIELFDKIGNSYVQQCFLERIYEFYAYYINKIKDIKNENESKFLELKEELFKIFKIETELLDGWRKKLCSINFDKSPSDASDRSNKYLLKYNKYLLKFDIIIHHLCNNLDKRFLFIIKNVTEIGFKLEYIKNIKKNKNFLEINKDIYDEIIKLENYYSNIINRFKYLIDFIYIKKNQLIDINKNIRVLIILNLIYIKKNLMIEDNKNRNTEFKIPHSGIELDIAEILNSIISNNKTPPQ